MANEQTLDQIPMDSNVIPSATPSRGRAARPVDPQAAEKKRRPYNRKPKEPEVPAPTPLDPKQREAMETTLGESLTAIISLACRHPAQVKDEEKAALGSCASACAETYLPGGVSRHLPAVALFGLVIVIVVRTIGEKRAYRAEQEAARRALEPDPAATPRPVNMEAL